MPITTLNSQAIPADVIQSSDLDYPLTDFSSTGIDDNATSTAVTIDSGGDLGVGETNPARRLSVKDNAQNVARFESTSTARAVISLLDANTTDDSSVGIGAITNDLALYSGNLTEGLRLNSNGTVGVGVTPATDWGDDGIQIGTKGTLSGGSSYTGYAFNAYPTSSGWASKYTTTDEASLYLQGAGLHLWYNAASGTAGTAVTWQERMRIDSSGNVGIGTNSPSYPLDVIGPIRINHVGSDTFATIRGPGNRDLRIDIDANGDTDSFVVRDLRDNSERFLVQASGNVGIGTTSPDQTLHVHKGSAGSVSSHASSVLTLENSTTGILQFLTPNTNAQQIRFGDPQDNGAGIIQYDHATSVMQFNVNGPERMRIDSSGNVGIGITSPVTHFNVNAGGSPNATYGIANFAAGSGVNSYVTVSRGGSDQGGIKILRGSVADLSIYVNSAESSIINYNGGDTSDGLFFRSGSAATEVMTLDSSGQVGIGTTNPLRSLQIGDNTSSEIISIQSGTTNHGSIYFGDNTATSAEYAGVLRYHHSNDSMSFWTSSTERARIDSSGNLLVGVTSSVSAGDEGIQLGTNGAIQTARNQTSSQTHMLFINPNGSVGSITTLVNATAFNTSSDQRLKENIVDAPAGNIDAIRVRSFDWKADGSHQTYGMVAQELVDVAPEAVSQGETEDDMWGVDYSKLVPMMIKEIQDLKAEVAALKGE